MSKHSKIKYSITQSRRDFILKKFHPCHIAWNLHNKKIYTFVWNFSDSSSNFVEISFFEIKLSDILVMLILF